ncbi:hypothetical protein Slin14017_G058510 [Septoria linicola]|nr:hypothetical protein Slin14017_G058510 [Septoria linicola]
MSGSPAVFFLKALISLPFVSVNIKQTDTRQDENLGYAKSNRGDISDACLTKRDTTSIVQKYSLYLTKYPGNATMLGELHEENVVTASDSLSYVFQKPLNTSLAHSLQDIIDQEAAVPGINAIFTSHICDTITWYWEFTTKPWPIRGIVILFVNLESRKIYKTYREVNVGAILLNQGSPECQVPSPDWHVSVGTEALEPE